MPTASAHSLWPFEPAREVGVDPRVRATLVRAASAVEHLCGPHCAEGVTCMYVASGPHVTEEVVLRLSVS